jgi:hypothetical protein
MTNEPRKSVLGAWSLVSLKRFRNDAFYRFPMGEAAVGRLIYSDSGVMAAFLMSAEWIAGTAKPDWSTFLSYSGHWRILNGDTVFHDVDAASITTLIGRPLERYLSFTADGMLQLRTASHIAKAGEKSHDELLWKRIT